MLLFRTWAYQLTVCGNEYIYIPTVMKFKWSDIQICISANSGSVVGIATAYRMDGPGIESRWGARFSAPVQTGPEAHPASCTMGTGSFPVVSCGRGVTLTPYSLLLPRSKIE